MTILPNLGPKAATPEPTKDGKRPESVELLLKVWLLVGIGELIHQVLQIVLAVFNREAMVAQLAATMTESDKGADYSPALLELSANIAIFGSAVMFMAIIGLLLFLLTRLAAKHKWAGTARRMWFAFSLYFAFRILLVFMAMPAGSDAPDWLFAVDGMLQILIGVAAAMGVVFAMREATLDYTGELAQIKAMEAERAKRLKELEAERKKDKDKK